MGAGKDGGGAAEILVVDDSLTVRMDLTRTLERGGLQVRGCPTAAEARRALADQTFALVILDVVLPDGDGIELLREIRRAPRTATTAVMLLSSEREVGDRIHGLATGADEYIGKPYDTVYVLARAQELVRRTRASAGPDSPSVLVIDDSPTFRAELHRHLAAAGYDVLAAGTGEEGLRMAADARPTAIIVDGMLPGIDGIGVIRQLRLDAALRATPCLLLTASDDAEAELHALDSGADAFVRKGDDAGAVLPRLGAMLRSAPGRPVARFAASVLGPKRILAVDDSPTVLQELSSSFRGEGYDVVCAPSGEAALELLAVEKIDCILLDLAMPGLGGFETCRRIKGSSQLRDTPLVILTGDDDRASMLAAFDVGADDFVAKSTEFPVLRARVIAQMRRKQLEDEGRGMREQLLRRELDAAEARAAKDLAETRAVLLDGLERKNKELEAFSYSVSHDLRAPLRSIEGFSRALLEDHGAELTPEARRTAERVSAAATRMARLIDDLLDLSRIGRLPLRRRTLDLSAMAREVARELELGEPGRSVTFEIEEGLTAEADPGLVRIVLDNLLGNAWKFTARSPIQRIAFGTSDATEPSTFVVSDTGAGFDQAYAARLFAPFQRLHGADEFPGTGIGLATVHRAVDRHGGDIRAEGTVGGGARFLFTLAGRRLATQGTDRRGGTT